MSDHQNKGGRPRQTAPAPQKLDAELTLRMDREGASAGEIAFAHATKRGVQVSRQSIARFLKRWRDRCAASAA